MLKYNYRRIQENKVLFSKGTFGLVNETSASIKAPGVISSIIEIIRDSYRDLLINLGLSRLK